MDFDDLDDAIDARIAEGDTEGLEGFAFEKKDLKEFKGVLPRIPKGPGLWSVDTPAKEDVIKMRAFIFYGLGDTAEDFKSIINSMRTTAPWIEIAVHEWPGHGSRQDEPVADDTDALVQDAFDAIAPALEEVKEGADCEGGKFAFIGRSIGCQLMVGVGKKVIMKYGMAPCAVVAMDRASLNIPLLSEAGQEVLDSDPNKVIKAFNTKNFETADKDKWAKSLRYGCDTKDEFFHKFDSDMLLLKSKKDGPVMERGAASSKFKLTTLKIKGSNETFQMPIEANTTVGEVMTSVSKIFAYKKGATVTALDGDGKEMSDIKSCEDVMTVDGIESFQYPRYTWPHPICIIGAGFYAVKMAMQYYIHKNYNVIMFDRHPTAGGDAWHYSATKYSRCQTDFGAFNIWWGHQFNFSGDEGYGTELGGRQQFTKAFKGPGSPEGGTVESGAGTGVDYNPVKHQILAGIQYAVKEYGMENCVNYQSEVNTLKIIGDPKDESRYYKLGIKSMKTPPDPEWSVNASVIYHFPGAYDINRIIDYPGEDQFGGQIGYGMGNGQGGAFEWTDENMKGKTTAVLGNGAFSVENVRSCAEHGASKVYIITRRKSLLCPRLPCWFCHQAPAPTPASMLLDIFKPMYECAGIEDPWSFYSVFANAAKTDCTLRQSSRFGIGDVSFLLHAIGLFEYRVDTLARCTKHCLHLTSGEKLEPVHHICKALGLLGDPRVDQLHAMTHKLGPFINGDWRRAMSADATGMDAKRFTTFSAGPGACAFVKQMYYLHTHPWEWEKAKTDETWNVFPVHKLSDTQPDNTIYMSNVSYEMLSGTMLANILPNSVMLPMGDEPTYKYCLIHTMHPTEKYYDYCKADWDRYQDMVKRKSPGFENVKWVEYPYKKEQVVQWFDDYSKKLNIPIGPEGPDEATKIKCIQDFKELYKYIADQSLPHLIRETKLLKSLAADEDPLELALASTTHALKKDLTSSKEGSALEYDDEQIESWKSFISSDYTFSSEALDVAGAALGKEPASWGKMLEYLQKYS